MNQVIAKKTTVPLHR